MALSDADLDAAWTKARSNNGPQWVPYFEALETCSDSGYCPYSYDEELVEKAAAAARARLEGKP